MHLKDLQKYLKVACVAVYTTCAENQVVVLLETVAAKEKSNGADARYARCFLTTGDLAIGMEPSIAALAILKGIFFGVKWYYWQALTIYWQRHPQVEGFGRHQAWLGVHRGKDF